MSAGQGDGQYSTAELLGRIDERTRNTQISVKDLGDKVESLGVRLVSVEKSLEAMRPVKAVVYGGIGIILVALLSTIIAMVMIKPGQEPKSSAPEPIPVTK